jgi:hypothetical protein
VLPAPGRLDDDPHGGDAERDAVGARGQRLRPAEAVGAARRRRPLRDALRPEGQREGGGVGHHVPRVGEERQAAGEEPGDHLDQHEAARQRERDGEARGGGRAEVVPMGVIVIVGRGSGRRRLALIAFAVIVAAVIVAAVIVVAMIVRHGITRIRRG